MNATMKARFGISSLILLMLADGCLSAPLTNVSLPGAARPEQIDRSLSPDSSTRFPTNAFTRSFAQPKPVEISLDKQAKKITFKLNAIILEGNRVYSAEQLMPIYQNRIGKTISVADVFLIAAKITNFYRNNGYIISQAMVPPQRVKAGVVKIKIIEAGIANVNITGSPYHAKYLLNAYGEKIKQDQPLQIKVLERYLQLANQMPGTEVKAVLSPSKQTTGASDLTLSTIQKPATGYISYDNYGTRYIGPQQATVNLTLNSFARSGDAAQMTYVKTPKGGELTYLDLNYNTPLGIQGTRWILGGTITKTHPLFILTPTEVVGETGNYYTTVVYPVIQTKTSSLVVQGNFTYIDTAVNTLGVQLYTDRIRSASISGFYNFSDQWYGTNLVSAELNKGLPILGYTSNQNSATAATSRPGAIANYIKTSLQLARIQRFRFSNRFSVYGLLKGQWTPDSLLSFEQFAFGGSQLGRGYDVAEIIGDKGAAGSVEVRYDIPFGRSYLNAFQLYGFYDAGVVWNFLRIGGTPTRQTATSAGVGSRFFFNKYFSGNLMFTQPISKQVAAQEFLGRGKCPRVFFSIVASSS